jgi:hypothetical protein
MNKTVMCVLILFFAITVALFAGQKELDDFLKSYEVSVIDLEETAKKPSVTADDISAWGQN